MAYVRQRVTIETDQFFLTLKEFATYLYQYPTMKQHIDAVEHIRNKHYTSVAWYSTPTSVVFEREWFDIKYLNDWLVNPDHLLFTDLCDRLGWTVTSEVF